MNLSFLLFFLLFSSSIAVEANNTSNLSTFSTWADDDDVKTKTNEYNYLSHSNETTRDKLNEELQEDHFESYMNYPRAHDKMTNKKTDYKSMLQDDVNTTYTDYIEIERIQQQAQKNIVEKLGKNVETKTSNLKENQNSVNDEDQFFEAAMNYETVHIEMTDTDKDFKSMLKDGISSEYDNRKGGKEITTNYGDNGGRRKMLRGMIKNNEQNLF